MSEARSAIERVFAEEDDGLLPDVQVAALTEVTARCEITLGPVYEGPPGCVHGGISAMILDHLCGCAAAANCTPGMTAGLDLRYRRPTPHSVPLVAEAKTVRVEGRKTFVEGHIADPDGRRRHRSLRHAPALTDGANLRRGSR